MPAVTRFGRRQQSPLHIFAENNDIDCNCFLQWLHSKQIRLFLNWWWNSELTNATYQKTEIPNFIELVTEKASSFIQANDHGVQLVPDTAVYAYSTSTDGIEESAHTIWRLISGLEGEWIFVKKTPLQEAIRIAARLLNLICLDIKQNGPDSLFGSLPFEEPEIVRVAKPGGAGCRRRHHIVVIKIEHNSGKKAEDGSSDDEDGSSEGEDAGEDSEDEDGIIDDDDDDDDENDLGDFVIPDDETEKSMEADTELAQEIPDKEETPEKIPRKSVREIRLKRKRRRWLEYNTKRPKTTAKVFHDDQQDDDEDIFHGTEAVNSTRLYEGTSSTMTQEVKPTSLDAIGAPHTQTLGNASPSITDTNGSSHPQNISRRSVPPNSGDENGLVQYWKSKAIAAQEGEATALLLLQAAKASTANAECALRDAHDIENQLRKEIKEANAARNTAKKEAETAEKKLAEINGKQESLGKALREAGYLFTG